MKKQYRTPPLIKLFKIQPYLLFGMCSMLGIFSVKAQNVDLENILHGKAFKVSGSVSANSVYYNSTQAGGREPFTYFLQGALNFSLYQFSMPVSYSFTNQGSKLNYDIPFKFNRLSLHPKYKWVQAHIGDVSMTFSPYTLSGHQFTGGGVDLTPKGGFKFSAMSGRLLKATEDNEDPRAVPAFKRTGYGLKASFEQKKYAVGIIGFYAKDDINSIAAVPDEKGITPKENLVLSIEGGYQISKEVKIKAEYASTAITQDTRVTQTTDEGAGTGLAGLFFNNVASTEHYNALKAGLEYSFDKSKVGVGYERIDPGYETLGAYYFNNDFENITVNYATVLFKDKLNLALNIGYQKDDLENQKESATNRTVGSINATFTASEKLNLTGSYSNFSTFTNIKPNQFETINDNNLQDDQLQELDYRQLSQNANLNVNYILAKTKTRQKTLNVNYSLADVANEQGGVVRIGDASTFHNLNTAYTIGYPNLKMNVTAAINATYNTIGIDEATTWGPTVNLNKKFLDNKLNTTFGTSYNTSNNKNSSASVLNFRANATYIYKEKHNFNLSAIQLFKNNNGTKNSSITVTFGYNYAFDLSGFKIVLPKRKKTPNIFGFSYKIHKFEGEPYIISSQINTVSNDNAFSEIKKIKGIGDKLIELKNNYINAELKSNKIYKREALAYLKYLYKYKNFLDTYYKLSFNSLKKLYKDGVRLDNYVNKRYQNARIIFNKAEIKTDKKRKLLETRRRALLAHILMLKELKTFKFDDLKQGKLLDFKNKNISKIFEMLENGKKEIEIYNYLEVEFAKFFHDLSIDNEN